MEIPPPNKFSVALLREAWLREIHRGRDTNGIHTTNKMNQFKEIIITISPVIVLILILFFNVLYFLKQCE